MTPSFVVLYTPSFVERGGGVGVGITVSRKIGKATVRNHYKRVIRELVKLLAPLKATKGMDYIVIARVGILSSDFSQMKQELSKAFKNIKKPAASS